MQPYRRSTESSESRAQDLFTDVVINQDNCIEGSNLETMMKGGFRNISNQKKRKSYPENEQFHCLSFQDDSSARDDQYICEMHKFEQRRQIYHENLTTFQSHMIGSPYSDVESSSLDGAIQHFVLSRRGELHNRSSNCVPGEQIDNGDTHMSVGAKRDNRTKWLSTGSLGRSDDDLRLQSELTAAKVLAFRQRKQCILSTNDDPISTNASSDGLRDISSAPEALEQDRRYKEMRQKLAQIAQETRRVSAALAQVVATRQLGRNAGRQTISSPMQLKDVGLNNLDHTTVNGNERTCARGLFNDLSQEKYRHEPESWLPVVSPNETACPTKPQIHHQENSLFLKQQILYSSFRTPDPPAFENPGKPTTFPPLHTIHKETSSDFDVSEHQVRKFEMEIASTCDVYRSNDMAFLDPRFGMASPALSSSDDPMP